MYLFHTFCQRTEDFFKGSKSKWVIRKGPTVLVAKVSVYSGVSDPLIPGV